MAKKTLSGVKTVAYLAERGTLVEGDGVAALTANTWYEIAAVAETGSTLPIGVVSAVFRTPDTGTDLTPVDGDNVYPITLKRICKTDAEISFEEGTIDTTDDCEEGFNAMILDGYRTISGSLNGFVKADDTDGTLVASTMDVFKRFINVVEDDAAGNYTVTPAENEVVLLFMLLNKNAKLGQKQNWIIVPSLITAFATGAGLKDAQKRDLTWTKGEGYPSLYIRTAVAGDII